MDISAAIQPRSDQQNYDDYIAGPKTVTVSEVRQGNREQPVEVHLVEFPGRPYKPAKSMLRVLAKAWGKDASLWAGRRMTLYGDPSVKFAGQAVGGIRISHLSHIDKPLDVPLTVAKARRQLFTVHPLEDQRQSAQQPDWQALIEQAGGDVEALRQLWGRARAQGASQEILQRIESAATAATTGKEQNE